MGKACFPNTCPHAGARDIERPKKKAREKKKFETSLTRSSGGMTRCGGVAGELKMSFRRQCRLDFGAGTGLCMGHRGVDRLCEEARFMDLICT